MKNILLTGCGGAPTLNFTRSLRSADPKREKYRLIGLDRDKYTVHRSECDKNYLCPAASAPEYIPFLLEIIKREKVDFMHTQPEVEVFTVGASRDKVTAAGCRLFMPRQETIEILRDKFKSYEVWHKAGITVPRNIKIDAPEDLKRAFAELGPSIWLRETVGAAGKGSLSEPTYEMAKAWIDFRKGWGVTVAAEKLTSRTTTWQSLWHDGRLVAGQGRERLYWEMGNRTQSGVTGVTGTGKIINDPALAELAIRCIKTVDASPNGIFSVDFTYDAKGIPNPTEINIGKFFTTHEFITRAGANMPEMMVALAFGEYAGPYELINPCKDDLYWVRGMDQLPVLVSGAEVESKVKEFEEVLRSIEQ